MIIFAADPGANYGFAVCDDGTITYSLQGKIPSYGTKIGYAQAMLHGWMLSHGRPDLVTVETPAVLGRASSFESLACQWSNVLSWFHAPELAGLREIGRAHV